MAKGGWNTTGALLLCVAFVLCLVTPTFRYSSGGGSFAFTGTFQGLLLPLFGMAIAWFGVRDGQRWAWWTLLLGLLVIAALRISADPACTVRIFTKHGCHQFMLGLLAGAVGLVLARE